MESKTGYDVSVSEMYLLNIKQAAAYFGIGEHKIRRLAEESLDSVHSFAIQNGTKLLINRKKFEKYLDNITSI